MNRRKLRIGITCFPTYGGSGVIATEIGMEMARRGHQIHFICLDIPRRLHEASENIYFHEVDIFDYPLFTHPPYDISLASKMVEVISYQHLDLLHVHYAVPHATSAYLAKQVLGEQAPPVITTLHGTDITLVGSDPSYLPITRFSIFQSDGVTAPSHSLKESTYEELNLPRQTRIEVIPNFVDVDVFRPPAADAQKPFGRLFAACPVAERSKVLTHVSNFRPVKRLEDVVQVFHLVNQQTPAHLVLIGDGPERSRTQELVRELQLQDRVCFLGKQDSFAPVLQHSDLFLLPSTTESFGLAALEAMACGVPVIATNVHGIPEVVVHGETGFLAPIKDVRGMADHALRLLNDRALHQRFSLAARRRAVDEFNLKDVVSRYEEYYRLMLGAKRESWNQNGGFAPA